MEYKRSMNVPMPIRQETSEDRKPGRPMTYPFVDLRVGESVLIPRGQHCSIGPSIQYASRRTGFKFVSRKEATGLRVWRAR